jgi:hypothetical protein
LQLASGALFALGAAMLSGPLLAASTAIGAGLMWFNLVILNWSWWRLLSKKSIAWSVIIIVIKYAALLGSVFILARTRWFDSFGAGLGIASFVPALLGLSLLQNKEQDEEIELN